MIEKTLLDLLQSWSPLFLGLILLGYSLNWIINFLVKRRELEKIDSEIKSALRERLKLQEENVDNLSQENEEIRKQLEKSWSLLNGLNEKNKAVLEFAKAIAWKVIAQSYRDLNRVANKLFFETLGLYVKHEGISSKELHEVLKSGFSEGFEPKSEFEKFFLGLRELFITVHRMASVAEAAVDIENLLFEEYFNDPGLSFPELQERFQKRLSKDIGNSKLSSIRR